MSFKIRCIDLETVFVASAGIYVFSEHVLERSARCDRQVDAEDRNKWRAIANELKNQFDFEVP